jgi:hypothetical protein
MLVMTAPARAMPSARGRDVAHWTPLARPPLALLPAASTVTDPTGPSPFTSPAPADASSPPFGWDPSVPPRFALFSPFDPTRPPFDMTALHAVACDEDAAALSARAVAGALTACAERYVLAFVDKPCCVADLQRYVFCMAPAARASLFRRCLQAQPSAFAHQPTFVLMDSPGPAPAPAVSSFLVPQLSLPTMEVLAALEPTAGRQAVDRWARAKVNLLALQSYARETIPPPPSKTHATVQEWAVWLHQSEAVTVYATFLLPYRRTHGPLFIALCVVTVWCACA